MIAVLETGCFTFLACLHRVAQQQTPKKYQRLCGVVFFFFCFFLSGSKIEISPESLSSCRVLQNDLEPSNITFRPFLDLVLKFHIYRD